jgi:hypothetical protein
MKIGKALQHFLPLATYPISMLIIKVGVGAGASAATIYSCKIIKLNIFSFTVCNIFVCIAVLLLLKETASQKS